MAQLTQRNRACFYLLIPFLLIYICIWSNSPKYPATVSRIIHVTQYPSMNPSKAPIYNEAKGLLTEFMLSLFCPIVHKSDKKKYNKLLNDIYDIQYNHSCGLDRKYYVLSTDKIPSTKGFIAFIDHIYTPAFALSTFTNRTFVIYTYKETENPYFYLPQNGKTIPNLCQNRTGKDCFFKRVSNCSRQQILDIINYAKSQNDGYYAIDYQHRDPNICHKSKHMIPERFHELTKDFMIIDQKFECHLFWDRGPAMNRDLVDTMIYDRNWNINYYQYTAIIWSILLRMQDNVKEMVYKIVNASLTKYKWKSKKNTISVPIRASDKCIPFDILHNLTSNISGYHFTNLPEMPCLENIEWINIAKLISASYQLIITSEDKTVISFMKNYTSISTSNTNAIFNDDDLLQNCGLVADMNENDRNNEFMLFRMVISMLSTIKLQMHSNYYIIQKSSNWAHAIWILSSCIHCNYNIDNNIIDNNINNDDQRYCISIDITFLSYNIFWDPHLFKDVKYTLNSTFSLDINHSISNINDDSQCYRRDRFPYQILHAKKLMLTKFPGLKLSKE